MNNDVYESIQSEEPIETLCNSDIHNDGDLHNSVKKQNSSQKHSCDTVEVNFSNVQEFPKKDCVMRTCPDCGVLKYEQFLHDKNKDLLVRNPVIRWKQWEMIPSINENITTKKMGTNYHTNPVKVVFRNHLRQLEAMSLCQFSKIWQLKMFNMVLDILKPGVLLLVHDFLQNLMVYNQDETTHKLLYILLWHIIFVKFALI